MRRLLAPVLCVLLAGPAPAQPPGGDIVVASVDPGALARVAPRPRPAPACSADGSLCIAAASYDADVCRAMEAAATRNALDPHFFARLIWRESLFDAGAVSPAGAEGIAQFMPETARLRGLADSFNPAEALAASAAYLADLSRAYGNVGLAAVAYNGGEARAERFIARDGGLPLETRAYVHAITGYPAESWRDAAPEKLDLTLAGEGGFQGACLALAASRTIREFPAAGAPLRPWGVVLASNRVREGAERQADRLRNRYAALLADEDFSFSRNRRPGMPRMHVAQIGRDTRPEADALCARLRTAGADCMVLKN
ncbi:lytic transglycosylase domain-containing protein [Amaricoccus sp.]|uniref:transglycosylase SLT domain-containing protein n=1 Tax=Amaricoccus sp. TaxID=1872485 RepID=UPI001B4F27D7|nr:lytic transglycosylase domain-containing protein [Amaricoccus sp.]MBP7000978.1 lytic transglycosylase domain-containing protein [Amaricoccus sp.]